MSELKQIAPTLSQRALMTLKTPSADEALKATQIARKILSGYPDYGKAPREYLLAVTEFIAYQIPEVQEALAHPTTGIATKCKFLPTIADIKEFIEARGKKHFPDHPRTYPLFKRGEGNPPNMPPPDRRKAVVLETLGYDPSKPEHRKAEPLPPAILDAIEENRWSSSMLKTPSGPLRSPELKALAASLKSNPQPVDTRATSEAA